MISKEIQFKNWLLEKVDLDKERIIRKKGETETHLRLHSGCGLKSLDEMIEILEKNNLSYHFYEGYSRSPDYRGHGLKVKWNNDNIGILVAIQKPGRIKRKELNPKTLGLDGYRTNSSKDFKEKIISGIKNHKFSTVLISMLDNVETGKPIQGLEKIQPQDINRITSDFGEILGAYQSVCNGNEIYFPEASNEPIADYYENNRPVSAKGRQTGGKVNLSGWKHYIDRKTDTGKLLYSIADHDKDNLFKYASKLSKEINAIKNMVGGTDQKSVSKYVIETSYDEFYNYIKNNPSHNGLGIPDEGRPRLLWENGSTEPFYFTINTLINRLWGWSATKEITKVVESFLKKPKFITVDIVNLNIETKEINFSEVKEWKTAYWSRATKAWHNWMAVEPAKGLK